MKTIEEKAIAYDEALDKSIEFYTLCKKCGAKDTTDFLESIFPELVESENNRIRKEIISALKWANHKGVYDKHIAWLEKQGENVDNENKADDFKFELNFDFSVGQWIVACGKKIFLITKIDGFNVTLIDTNGDEYVFDVSSLKDARLWTIKDAKDGDVLVDDNNNIGLYRKEQDGLDVWASYIYLGCDNRLYGFSMGGYHSIKNTKPATKEQSDLLFQKMKAKGYEWDAEKKEPKKIEPHNSDKVAPKFKVGEWVVFNNDHDSVYQIEKIENFRYILRHILGGSMLLSFSSEDMIKHWTISYAKSGDVLVAPKIDGSEHSEQIFIFKEIKDRDYAKNAIEYYCRVVDGEFYMNEQGFMGQSDDYFVPATKEQRDLLFSKMKEADFINEIMKEKY